MTDHSRAPITVPITHFIAERELRESIARHLDIQIDPDDFELRSGHWCVRMCGAFKRVTECLIAHTTGEVRTYDQSRPRITRRSA